MSLARRVARASVALDRVPRQSPRGDLPPELLPFAEAVRDAHHLVVEARDDPALHGVYDTRRYDAFLCAYAFGIELRRLQGEDVSWRERQLERWREERALETAVTLSERISAARPEPEPEIPEPIVGEVRQAIDHRRQMRRALGRPSAAHRDWSELLGGRTL